MSPLPPTSDEPRRPSWLWREWLKPVVFVVAGMLSLRSAVADWNHVPSESMMPTILVGDRIFVNKLAYDLRVPFTRMRVASWSAPERGDIVVFLSPADGKRLVKRVVGLPGDVLEMRDKRLIVNDRLAHYAPLGSSARGELAESEQARYTLTAESVDGAPTHPILIAPWRPYYESFGPLAVPLEHYFVLGDNRDDSADSRAFGFVSAESILGQATAIALSVDPEHTFRPRWSRFFSGLR
ncbi:MAG TPA: signal peptidase I [Thermoanaerobaculia bacterium]|nr:signal peptidase I [Thermoanaerobaculia bacterium]